MSTPDTPTRSPASTALPAQEICREALLEKYAKGDETSVEQVRRRVARALAQAEAEDKRAKWEKRFLQAQEDGFIPAGRIKSAAGIQLQATLINCFVQPVGDSISEDRRRQARHLHRARRRRPKPCAAAAASATTFPRSAPRARR